MESRLIIRSAKSGDEGDILALLHALAEYEKLTHIFAMTESSIAKDFLAPSSACCCSLALEGSEPVGLATWYWTYSSFRSMRGIYLEDLYVRATRRGRGYGKALLAHLARTSLAEGGRYVRWAVLDWNKPSIEFYESLGAQAASGWTTYQLSGDKLSELAET